MTPFIFLIDISKSVVMNGYSEEGAIYFQIGSKTGFAIYINDSLEIVSGSYIGEPPYKPINKSISTEHKKYHEAEHQIYNCFMKKIKNLNSKVTLQELKNYIPSLYEAYKTDSFSIFCGTSFLKISGILLITSSLINFLNLDWTIKLYILFFLILNFFILSYLTQKSFYLKKSNIKHLRLAREALKEALNDE